MLGSIDEAEDLVQETYLRAWRGFADFARQRAALILRDAAGWPIPDIASLLDTTAPAVNSALQRARATLTRVTPAETPEPSSAERQSLLDRYVTAFESLDLDALARILAA